MTPAAHHTPLEMRTATCAGVTYGVIIDDTGTHATTTVTKLCAEQLRAEWQRAEQALPDGAVFGGWILTQPGQHLSDSQVALHPDEPPQWASDVIAGERVPDSGHALLVAATVLRESGRITLVDRRETVPLRTLSGVHDVLFGVAGVASDLGRWRLKASGGDWLVAELAGQLVRARTEGSVPDNAPQAGNEVTIDPNTATVLDGVGTVQARASTPSGDLASHGLGACAAALLMRRLLGRHAPHHWAVMFPGGKLAVRLFPTEEGEHVSLSASVEMQQK